MEQVCRLRVTERNQRPGLGEAVKGQ
jgi:hypothetical protein